jgi:hypothetical protein
MEAIRYSEMRLVHLSAQRQFPENRKLVPNSCITQKLREFITEVLCSPYNRKRSEMQFGVTINIIATQLL